MARKRRTYFAQEEVQEKEVMEAEAMEWSTAIYARLSIENSKKNDKGESIEGQIEICREYVEEHPYLHLADTYIDNGWTGTNTNRPEFQRMIADIQAGKIKALVIKDFSRFSRDYIEAGNLLENIFPAYGIRFISVSDRYDSFETDGTAESLLIPLKNLINSFYSKDISRKVSTAVHARQLAAQHIPSMIPYGYRKSMTMEYRFEPDPETADNVKRIFRQRLEGVPLRQIAEGFNREEVPSPGKLRYLRGQTTDKRYATSRWSAQLIKQILKNPTYLGDLVFGRMPTALYLGKPDYAYEPDESKWRVLKDMHEPLVSQEDFDKVKEMEIEGRKAWEEKKAAMTEESIRNVPFFKDIVYCGDCGSVMKYKKSRFKPERLTGSYFCNRYNYKKCDRSHTITQELLKSIVWQSMQDQLLLFCDYERVLELLKDGRTTALMDEYRTQIQSLGVQMNHRRAKRERLYEDFNEGILIPEEYMMLKKKYDDEYQALNIQYNLIQTKMMKLKKSLSDKNPWMIQMRKLKEAKKLHMDLLEALVERILVYHDADNTRRVEIQYKYVADFELIKSAYEELTGGEA